jgi:hypothetical protein
LPQGTAAADPAGQYPPAVHVRHSDTFDRALLPTKVPAGHGNCTPPEQKEPGGHSTARAITSVALVTTAATV